MPPNVRFVAELTDGDPPTLRARCTELDVAISIDTGAFVRPEYALGAIVADTVAQKIPAGQTRRVVVDIVYAPPDRYTNPEARRICDFDLRDYRETLDSGGRDFALRETVPA